MWLGPKKKKNSTDTGISQPSWGGREKPMTKFDVRRAVPDVYSL